MSRVFNITHEVGHYWVVRFQNRHDYEVVLVSESKRCLPNTYTKIYVQRVGEKTRIPNGEVSEWVKQVYSDRDGDDEVSQTQSREGFASIVGSYSETKEGFSKGVSIYELNNRGGFMIKSVKLIDEIPPGPRYREGAKNHATTSTTSISVKSMDKIMQIYGQWKLTGNTITTEEEQS